MDCGRRKRPTVAAVAKGKSLIGGGDDELVDKNCVSDLLLTKGGKSVMNQHSRRRTLRFASLFLVPPPPHVHEDFGPLSDWTSLS